MTELVSPHVSRRLARSGLGRSLCAALVSLSVVCTLPSISVAAPAQGQDPEGPTATPDPTSVSTSETGELPDPTAIRSALEAGDLSSARDLAVARSAAEPSADNFALEAEVWLALGDYEQAKAALDRAIAAIPESANASDDREALERLREEIDEDSRGAKLDEPVSSHREQLDHDRADRLAALTPAPEPVSEPTDEPKPPTPIIKKWYFWVTLGAIAATAGAIVGIAVASSVQERNSDAASRQPAPAGAVLFRF